MPRLSAPSRAAANAIGFFLTALLLAGCATPMGAASSTDAPTPDASTQGPTPEPSMPEPSAPETPLPAPSASIGTDGGDGTRVVFITLDVVDETVEASGMLPDVVEENGTCILTLVQGGQTRIVEGDAAAGPESTYCGLLTVPTADLSSGEWTATLGYRSVSHEGMSAAATVSVP